MGLAITLDSGTGRVVLKNGRLELVIETRTGMNPCGLRDLKSGRVYADANYVWALDKAPVLIGTPAIAEKKGGTCSVTLKGKAGALEIEQAFSAREDEPGVITEVIGLRNSGGECLEIPSFACGFAKRIHDGRDWLADVAKSRLCDVPYRRHTETAEVCDFTVPELAARKNWFSMDRRCRRQESDVYGAEGWAWYGGGNTLLTIKYNPDALEWSLLEVLPKVASGSAEKALRFGGAGRWKLGDPERAARLAPGGSFTFGVTRYEALDGDWREAYAVFRRFTESKGHVLPKGYNPPVHWNELYDNKLWWAEGGVNAENQKKYYQRKDMEEEAAKARELGCECLYLDPGWDTVLGSTIWAEDRLGSQESFVAMLREKYGLALALHTPLAPWSDLEGFPEECRRMDKDGTRQKEICPASSLYMEMKIARFKELCKNGAAFLMYDGSWFLDGCCDKSHGHSLPLTHDEHLDAILRIEREVHAEYPHVLIEQHDPMAGPGTVRYAPTYFLHAKPGAFDELWGYEYMWDIMDDVTTRRAVALYYANLAYSIPIYLHIDLRKDNPRAMAFWWYASTCRHLGVGGKHADPATWEAHKSAMRTYLSLKRFFTQGVFHGLDEMVHVHTLPDLREAVLNVFNIENKTENKTIRFRLSDVGLPEGAVEVEGASFTAKNGEVILEVSMPGASHQLVKVRVL
jgi:hypothetical protein